MKAIQVHQAGSPEELKLEECPIPKCKPDEVLVKIQAAGINYIDIYFRKGLYNPPQYPYIPGKEGSGTVSALGEKIKHLKVGDRVAFCFAGSGAYAEYATIPADRLVTLPHDISFETGAAVMLQGLTAYYLTHKTFQLCTGHTALIHAGAGGVGLLLIQMAKLLGAKVITTVSSEEKAKLVKEMGADEVIIYTKDSFLDKIMELTNQAGVNVVYDSVGKSTFEDSLKALATRGMLVTYGQSSGTIPPFELSKLSAKSLFISRPMLGDYIATRNDLLSMSNDLFGLIRSKKLKITIGHRYHLSEASKAHADLESRKTQGKSIFVL